MLPALPPRGQSHAVKRRAITFVDLAVPQSRSFDVAVCAGEGCFSFSRSRRSSVTVAPIIQIQQGDGPS